MRMRELLHMVGVNMMRNKFRSLLTSLGIIVGTITIILVIAIGQGGERKAAEQFSGLSADTIYVNTNYAALTSGLSIAPDDELTPKLLEQIMDESVALEGMYLRTNSYTEVKLGGKKELIQLYGVTDGYADISGLSIELGQDLSESDHEGGSRVAVIGRGLADKYFGSAKAALGQNVLIDKFNYRIIGVLERSGDGLQGMNPDDTLFAPYSALVQQDAVLESTYGNMVGKARGIDNVKLAMREIESTLRYRLNMPSLYKVEDAGSRINAATASARNMKLLLISVAAIVFLVSGIGIMNVLFVTIKERTREIGILGALGMRRRDILMQFLMESMCIGMSGGAVGVVLSGLCLAAMRSYTEIPLYESVEGKLVAFLFAVITGTLFRLYPALKASRLRPVEALAEE